MEVDPMYDCECTAASNVVNLLIVGKAGNGKSATGNSILGREAFFSDVSSSGVASTSELQETVMTDGRILRVIDTPGLFDFSTPSIVTCREIVTCVDLAEDGIHAVLMVFSIGCRFTKEEEAAVKCMKSLFGDEIFNYMIIVFTGGDTLESKGKSLRDYSRTFPDNLKDLIQLCSDRVILFDNTTSDTSKRKEQVNELLSLVESIIAYNGVPYSDKIFAEVKKGALLLHQKEKELEAKVGCSEAELSELMKEKKKLYDDQLKRITEMVEEKLKLAVETPEKQLAEEKAARLKAERLAEKTDVEIQRLKAELNDGRKESKELKRRHAEHPKQVEEKLKLAVETPEKQLAEEKAARLKAERLAKETEVEIQRLKAELNDRRKESEELKRRHAEHPNCAIL